MKNEKTWVKFMVVAGLTIILIGIGRFALKNLSDKKQGAERLREPKIKTGNHKRLSEDEWKHFDYAVSECRIVIGESPFLKARTDFWEKHDIEPAVGYTAWLFQESRFNGNTTGDDDLAVGYGQIHPTALKEINKLRAERGDETFTHESLYGRSRKRLRFFLEAIHDYRSLCPRRATNNLDLKMNFWNGGCKGGKVTETTHSGRIKSFILQYYKRKEAEREAKEKAGAKSTGL